MGRFDNKVAIITGAGRGIGREHALLFAREGAAVVVNDLGGDGRGEGADETPAQEVVREIVAAGGRAVANGADVTNWDAASGLVEQAVETFGGLDILVNNAGILRDRMSFNMTEEDFDAVVGVILKGSFSVARFAAAHWRDKFKETGEPVNASIVNTSSASGLWGVPGQANYGAAKGGLLTLTLILARELERFGVRANVIAPIAFTRLTATIAQNFDREPAPDGFDPHDPKHIAPLVAWLCSDLASDVSGQIFAVSGEEISLVGGHVAAARVSSERTDWSIDRIEGLRDQFFAETGPGIPSVDPQR